MQSRINANWDHWLKKSGVSVLLKKWLNPDDPELNAAKLEYHTTQKQKEEDQLRLKRQAVKWFDTENKKTKRVIKRDSLSQLVALYEQVDPSSVEMQDVKRKMESFYVGKGFSGQMGDVLWPLNGVILGKTPVEELQRLGNRTDGLDGDGKPYHAFDIRNITVWNDNGVADIIYITKHEKLPTRWQLMGFDYDNSYVKWLRLFSQFGWQVKVIKEPKNAVYEGHESFIAELQVINGSFDLYLIFGYSTGNSQTSPNTLYSIDASRVKNETKGLNN